MQYQFSESIGRISQDLSRNIGKLLVNNFKAHGYKITRDEWTVIAYVLYYKKMNQQNIAIHIGRDKVAVTRILDKLQGEGYIKRKTDRKDKRNNIASLTPKGKELYNTLRPVAGETLEMVYNNIPKEDIERSINTLNKMLVNIEEALVAKPEPAPQL